MAIAGKQKTVGATGREIVGGWKTGSETNQQCEWLFAGGLQLPRNPAREVIWSPERMGESCSPEKLFDSPHLERPRLYQTARRDKLTCIPEKRLRKGGE